MKLFYALTISAVILLVAGCSKSSDNPSSTDAKAILTSGKWQFSSGTSTFSYPGVPTTTQDLTAITPTCVADNFTTFNADGTGTLDEGATKCDASAPQVVKNQGSWKLLNNNTQLQLDGPTSPVGAVTLDILQLDDSYLKIKYTVSNAGAVATTTETFKHIK